jgi:hypothetical protein
MRFTQLRLKWRIYARVLLCGALAVVVAFYGSSSVSRSAAGGYGGTDRASTAAAATSASLAAEAAGRSLNPHRGRLLSSSACLGSSPLRTPAARCPDDFRCPGRLVVNNESSAEAQFTFAPYSTSNFDRNASRTAAKNVDDALLKVDFCNEDADSKSLTCKYARYCAAEQVDCGCCNDGIAGRECKTRILVGVGDARVADAALCAITTALGAGKKISSVASIVEHNQTGAAAQVDSSGSAFNNTVVYELLLVIPTSEKGQEEDPKMASRVSSLKEAREAVKTAFATKGGVVGPMDLDMIHIDTTYEGVKSTTTLYPEHQLSVSDGASNAHNASLNVQVCHPCCYTKRLSDDLGTSRTAHPHFRGDYEACLNNADGWKPVYNDRGVHDSSTFAGWGKSKTVGRLDYSCTTMAGYFDMGISAFQGGGWIFYIIGILYVPSVSGGRGGGRIPRSGR